MARRGNPGERGMHLPGSVAALKKFLASATCPAGALSYHELQGFLFTIAAVPDMVVPSEWIPLIFGGREPEFEGESEAQRILGGLMQLYNEVNTDVFDREARLPEDCRFREDLLSNLSEDAPIAKWSRGFIRGHTWLTDTWDEYVPKELEEEWR